MTKKAPKMLIQLGTVPKSTNWKTKEKKIDEFLISVTGAARSSWRALPNNVCEVSPVAADDFSRKKKKKKGES